MSEIRTILADAVAAARGTRARLLELEPDIAVIGEYADGGSALAAIRSTRPHVALLTADLPVLTGIRVAAGMAGETPGTRVLILASITASCVVTSPGVAGYVAATAASSRIAEAVRAVAGGGTFFDTDLSYVTRADLTRGGTRAAARPAAADRRNDVPGRATGDIADAATDLTARERSVLTALSHVNPLRRISVREISEAIGMSPEAVGLTMNSLLAKTGGQNRWAAIRIASARGWI